MQECVCDSRSSGSTDINSSSDINSNSPVCGNASTVEDLLSAGTVTVTGLVPSSAENLSESNLTSPACSTTSTPEKEKGPELLSESGPREAEISCQTDDPNLYPNPDSEPKPKHITSPPYSPPSNLPQRRKKVANDINLGSFPKTQQDTNEFMQTNIAIVLALALILVTAYLFLSLGLGGTGPFSPTPTLGDPRTPKRRTPPVWLLPNQTIGLSFSITYIYCASLIINPLQSLSTSPLPVGYRCRPVHPPKVRFIEYITIPWYFLI